MSKHENLGVQLNLPIQQNVEVVALHSFNYIFVDWWLFNSPMPPKLGGEGLGKRIQWHTSLDLSLGLGAHNKGGGENKNSTPQNLLHSSVGTELLARLGDWPLCTIENILIGTIWRLKKWGWWVQLYRSLGCWTFQHWNLQPIREPVNILFKKFILIFIINTKLVLAPTFDQKWHLKTGCGCWGRVLELHLSYRYAPAWGGYQNFLQTSTGCQPGYTHAKLAGVNFPKSCSHIIPALLYNYFLSLPFQDHHLQ